MEIVVTLTRSLSKESSQNKKKSPARARVKTKVIRMNTIVGRGETELYKYVWEIDIDTFCGKKIGEDLLSPKFITINDNKLKNKWQLQIYPKGNQVEDNKKVAIYLLHLSQNKVKVSVYFSLVNTSNHRVEFFSLQNKLFEFDDNWGSDNFVDQKFILDPKNKIVNNNKLKISCEIVFECQMQVKEVENIKKMCNKKCLDKFDNLFTNEEFSDVTVKAEEKSFHLHKCILAASSDVFADLFRKDSVVKKLHLIEIEGIKSNVLEELFRYIYIGKVEKIEKIVADLLIAAAKYQIEGLKVMCEEKMISMVEEMPEESVKKVIEYLKLAIRHDADQLKASVMEWLSFNLDVIIDKEDLDQFGVEYPEVLLQIMKKYFNP